MRQILTFCLVLCLTSCGFKFTGKSDTEADDPTKTESGEGGFVADVCGVPATFADEVSPTQILHVAPTGNDTTGNGSSQSPYLTISRAAQGITGGTAIRVHPGTYAGGISLTNLAGTRTAPIWIGGVEGDALPVIDAGNVGIHITRANYLVLHDLEIANTTTSGIIIEDGGDYANEDAARNILLRNLYVHDVGAGSGEHDCIQLAGVNDYFVIGSELSACGGSTAGSGLDQIGCHRGLVLANYIHDPGHSAVQARGGSFEIDIRANLFENGGVRAVNMGGMTTLTQFRPPLSTVNPNFEARYIRVLANVFTGGESAAVFAGCAECTFANNTVNNPLQDLLRITQETTDTGSYTFLRASEGEIFNNIFHFDRSQLAGSEDIYVGNGTWSSTFSLKNNLWYAHDDPASSTPRTPSLGTSESDGIWGEDPRFLNPAILDFRLLPDSPASESGVTGSHLIADFNFACFSEPPPIGAHAPTE